jgi:hypothetical protein
MSLKESLAVIFEPKEVKEAREIQMAESARHLESLATGAYLEGRISIDDYHFLNKLTYPFTKPDLRKLAQNVNRMRLMNQDRNS